MLELEKLECWNFNPDYPGYTPGTTQVVPGRMSRVVGRP